MEEHIMKIRKDNIEQSNKLKKLKNMQYTQGKELETNNLLKKFPNQINAFTDEIKNLVSKKQEYFTKISNNKKSLSNLKNILTNISKNYEKITNSKVFQKTAENSALINSIEESVNSLLKDLNMPEDELFEKINNLQTLNKYTYISSNNNNLNLNLLSAPQQNGLKSKTTIGQANPEVFGRRASPGKNFNNYNNKRNIYNNNNNINYGSSIDNNNSKYSKGNGNYLRNKSPQLSLPQILPPIVNRANKERSSSPYKGIFNKYEYLASKDKNTAKSGIGVLNAKYGKKALSGILKNHVINSASKVGKNDSNLLANRNGSISEKNIDSGEGKLFLFKK